MHEVLTKSAFASFVGVTRGRVSQWLADRKISGDAIVGTGVRARIRVPLALEQLKQTLDVDQRLTGNARARLDGEPSRDLPRVEDTLEDKIKTERLGQIALSNAKARQEQAARSGRYILAEDARQEMGRIAGRMATLFEASLSEFANAVTATPANSPRDALLVLRASWRAIRARQAQGLAEIPSAWPWRLSQRL